MKGTMIIRGVLIARLRSTLLSLCPLKPIQDPQPSLWEAKKHLSQLQELLFQMKQYSTGSQSVLTTSPKRKSSIQKRLLFPVNQESATRTRPSSILDKKLSYSGNQLRPTIKPTGHTMYQVKVGIHMTKKHSHYNHPFNKGPEDHDQEEDRLSLEDTPTIQDAIKNEAKKLVPNQQANQKGVYPLSEKEFLLPGQVYGSNFPQHSPGCYQMPDGFVTPLRVTPHRNLASSPPVLEDGKISSQTTGNRLKSDI